jgi:hypothetical protein
VLVAEEEHERDGIVEFVHLLKVPESACVSWANIK